MLNHTEFEQHPSGAILLQRRLPGRRRRPAPLFSGKPNSLFKEPRPISAEPPKISAAGKTITVHIRTAALQPAGEPRVTSADVADAIERGAKPNVCKPYFPSYFISLEGADKAKGGPIPGITRPNKYTIVFHPTNRTPRSSRGVVLPLSAPVPEEYAKRNDAKTERIRQLRGRDGVHVQERSAGKVLGIGYVPASRRPRAQPQLECGDRLPARVPKPDRHQIGGDRT